MLAGLGTSAGIAIITFFGDLEMKDIFYIILLAYLAISIVAGNSDPNLSDDDKLVMGN